MSISRAESEPVDDSPPRHDIPAGGRSGFLMVEERQVHYLEWGRRDAPAVTCLHGGGQTAYMWEDLGSVLGTRYALIAPDLPGHGDSDLDLGVAGGVSGLDRRRLADGVEAVLDAFGVDETVLVGASLGGITALTLAAASPSRVAGIVLVDIGHRLEDEGVQRIVEFMTAHESFASLEEASVAVAQYLPNRKTADPQRLKRNLRQRSDGRWVWKHALGRRLRAAIDEGATFDGGGWRQLVAGMDTEIAGLDCPVLVLRGGASDVLSDEGAKEVAELIPDARLATVESAGHHAAGDNPHTTTRLVADFLDEIGWG